MSNQQSLSSTSGKLRADHGEFDVAVTRRAPEFIPHAGGYAAAFEQAAIGMALVGLNGRLLAVNRALCRILGYEADELLGTRFDAAMHPDEEPLDLSDARRLLNQELIEFHTEKRYVHKQGHALWVQLSVSLVCDAARQPSYFIAQLQDVTARKRAESTFRALLESAPDAMMITDAAGRIVLANAQAVVNFGYGEDEMRDLTVEALIPERFRSEHPAHRERYLANPRTRGMGAGRQLFALRKDGSEFPVEIMLSPLELDGASHVCCALRDLTKWSHADDARRRVMAAEQLAHHRDEMAQMLRLNAMSEIAAGIAHELNQPLSAIANYARGAARRLQQGTAATDEIRTVVDSIGEEAVRASEIIRSVKRFLKKQEPKRAVVDLNEVVENAFRLVAGEAHNRGVEFVFDACATRPTVLGDAIQLEQVVVNLLTNALDALDEVPHAKLLLVETAVTTDGMAEVRVVDNGCGLPTVEGVDVFEAFMTTRPRGWGWAWRSAGRSSSPTVDIFGR